VSGISSIKAIGAGQLWLAVSDTGVVYSWDMEPMASSETAPPSRSTALDVSQKFSLRTAAPGSAWPRGPRTSRRGDRFRAPTQGDDLRRTGTLRRPPTLHLSGVGFHLDAVDSQGEGVRDGLRGEPRLSRPTASRSRPLR
jgi:hypothetical protein